MELGGDRSMDLIDFPDSLTSNYVPICCGDDSSESLITCESDDEDKLGSGKIC